MGLSGREGGVAARSALGIVGAFFRLSFGHSLWAPKDVQAVGAATRTLRKESLDSFLRQSPPFALLRAAVCSRLPARGTVGIVVLSQPPTAYEQPTGLRFPSACARPEPRRRQPPTSRESPRWPRGEGGVWVRAAVPPERGELGLRLREAVDLRVDEVSVLLATPNSVPAARGAQFAGPWCGRSRPAPRPGSAGSSTRRGGGSR